MLLQNQAEAGAAGGTGNLVTVEEACEAEIKLYIAGQEQKIGEWENNGMVFNNPCRTCWTCQHSCFHLMFLIGQEWQAHFHLM